METYGHELICMYDVMSEAFGRFFKPSKIVLYEMGNVIISIMLYTMGSAWDVLVEINNIFFSITHSGIEDFETLGAAISDHESRGGRIRMGANAVEVALATLRRIGKDNPALEDLSQGVCGKINEARAMADEIEGLYTFNF